MTNSPRPPLDLVVRLRRAMDNAEVRWCHWKSNATLAAALAGEEDLDLLIDPASFVKVGRLLAELDICAAWHPGDLRADGIHDYYGYDEPSGSIVHVHLHTDLVVGVDRVKDVRLPLVEAFLTDTRILQGTPVPAAALEYIALVLRLALKRHPRALLHLPWRQVLLAMRRQAVGAVAGRDLEELAWLERQLAPNDVAAACRRHAPWLAGEQLLALREALGGADGGGWQIGLRADRLLAQWRRYSRAESWRRTYAWRLRELWGHLGSVPPSRKRLLGGGRLIAVVGGDGAGKTTQVEALRRWLGEVFVVRSAHFGKPPAGRDRRAIGLVFRLLWRRRYDDLPVGLRDLASVALACDRRRLLARMQRYRRRGEIIVMDRCHLPGFAAMDGPVVDRRRSRMAAQLADLEQVQYDHLARADLVIGLPLDPATAVARKPEDGAEYTYARNEAFRAYCAGSPDIATVDAVRPLAEVLAETRRLVWAHLPRSAPWLEIVGLPGAGKTTFVGCLHRLHPGCLDAMSSRSDPRGWVVAWWRTRHDRARLRELGLPRIADRALVHHDHLSTRLADALAQGNGRRSGLILDEGPVHTLVWLAGLAADRDCRSEIWPLLERRARLLARGLAEVVVLETEPEVSLQRIEARDADHRIRNLDRATALPFLVRVRQDLTELLAAYSAAGGSVTHIATAEAEPREVYRRYLFRHTERSRR